MKRTIIDTAADHPIISILLVFAVGILIISALAGPPAAESTAPKSLEEQQAAVTRARPTRRENQGTPSGPARRGPA